MRKLLDKFLSPYYFSRQHNFLRIESEHILKLHGERPDIVDAIKNREIQLVINTPSGKLSKYDDSYIRKSAVKYQVLYITTTAAAVVVLLGVLMLTKVIMGLSSRFKATIWISIGLRSTKEEVANEINR